MRSDALYDKPDNNRSTVAETLRRENQTDRRQMPSVGNAKRTLSTPRRQILSRRSESSDVQTRSLFVRNSGESGRRLRSVADLGVDSGSVRRNRIDRFDGRGRVVRGGVWRIRGELADAQKTIRRSRSRRPAKGRRRTTRRNGRDARDRRRGELRAIGAGSRRFANRTPAPDRRYGTAPAGRRSNDDH